MKRNQLTVIFSMVALFSIVLLTAFTFANPNINEDEPNETSSLDINEQINEIVEIEEETKPVENTSEEVSSTPKQAVQSEKVEATESSFDKVKTLTVQGKKITANFVERQEMDNPNFRERHIYKSDDGATLEYDSITGQLLYMERDVPFPDRNSPKITSDKAISIAQKFIRNYTDLDLSKYTLIRCHYYENSQRFDVNYSWLYCGYTTGNSINVQIRENGEIRSFSSNPYLFNSVEMKSIDERVLLKELDEQVKKYRRKTISYKIDSQAIGVDLDNDMIMIYNVDIEYDISEYFNENIVISESKQEKKTTIESTKFTIKIE